MIPVPGCEPKIDDMLAALDYIRQNLRQVDIINMSVGQLQYRKGLDERLRDLAGDTILIAAAGKCDRTQEWSPSNRTHQLKRE